MHSEVSWSGGGVFMRNYSAESTCIVLLKTIRYCVKFILGTYVMMSLLRAHLVWCNYRS